MVLHLLKCWITPESLGQISWRRPEPFKPASSPRIRADKPGDKGCDVPSNLIIEVISKFPRNKIAGRTPAETSSVRAAGPFRRLRDSQMRHRLFRRALEPLTIRRGETAASQNLDMSVFTRVSQERPLPCYLASIVPVAEKGPVGSVLCYRPRGECEGLYPVMYRYEGFAQDRLGVRYTSCVGRTVYDGSGFVRLVR